MKTGDNRAFFASLHDSFNNFSLWSRRLVMKLRHSLSYARSLHSSNLILDLGLQSPAYVDNEEGYAPQTSRVVSSAPPAEGVLDQTTTQTIQDSPFPPI